MRVRLALRGYYSKKTLKVTLDHVLKWARKLKDDETRYNAYDKEALAIVEVVSRVWRVYLLGCK